MKTNQSQKLKLLYLMDILLKETDEDHGLSMPQIITRLQMHGITAERKSLYADLDALKEFGLDIQKLKGRPVTYAVVERNLKLSQISLIIDAIQSSRFLSEGSARALTRSIKNFASVHQQKLLNKQVHVYGRPARQNYSDFYAVDKLQEAMAERNKVAFTYVSYNTAKERVPRHNAKRYVVSPVNLTYADGNYYLVAYHHESAEIRNYRVDRMEDIETLEEKAVRNEAVRAYDADEIGQCVFGMYDGKKVVATFKVAASAMNVVIDRFGQEVRSHVVDDGQAALVTAPVKISPVLFGWIAQLGQEISIEEPQELREAYLLHLNSILKVYE